VSAQPLPVAPEAPRRRAPASRSRLALVPAPVRARRAPFVVLLLVLLASGLVGLLLLNTASAQDSFRLHTLQDEDAALQQQQQALTSMADGLDDPSRLAARAASLGLVPGDPPVFLPRGVPIPKGAIRVGNLIYAPGVVPVTPPPPVVVSTPVQPTVKPVAKKAVAKKPVVARKVPVTKIPVAPKVPAKTATTAPVAKTPVTAVPHATTTTPTTTRIPVKTTTTATNPAAGGH
jgi:hypothetical protein